MHDGCSASSIAVQIEAEPKDNTLRKVYRQQLIQSGGKSGRKSGGRSSGMLDGHDCIDRREEQAKGHIEHDVQNGGLQTGI
jgi:hypothetical protein